MDEVPLRLDLPGTRIELDIEETEHTIFTRDETGDLPYLSTFPLYYTKHLFIVL